MGEERHHQGGAAAATPREISCSPNGSIDRIGDHYLLTVPVKAGGMEVVVGIGAEVKGEEGGEGEVEVEVEVEVEGDGEVEVEVAVEAEATVARLFPEP